MTQQVLVISEQMRAQIAGLNQAIDNSETAVAMVQTAEGALDEINGLLNKARELAFMQRTKVRMILINYRLTKMN